MPSDAAQLSTRVLQARGIRIGNQTHADGTPEIEPVTDPVSVTVKFSMGRGAASLDWQDRISFPGFSGVIEGVGFYDDEGDLLAWRRIRLEPGDALEVGGI